MLAFTNFDADGNIIQSGTCPNKDCLPPKRDDTAWLFGVIGMPDRHKVVDGEVREIEIADH